MGPVKPSKQSEKSSKPTKRKLVEEPTISRPVERSKKSKTSRTKEPSPDPQSSHSAEEDGDEEGDEEDEEILHGFSTDDDDSSDEEMVEEPAIDVTKLPTIAKDDATVKKRLEKAKRKPTEERGVLYIGRLPHGFYEDQLKAYFSQFGDVTRLRVSRNKKTGKSKHYGFLEFDSSSVAQIVAETMDNYLLMGHILSCKIIPKDEVHPELWVGANRKWRRVPRQRVARVAQNMPRTEEKQVKATKRLIKRQNDTKRKLKELGITYNMDAVGYKKPAVAS